MRSKSRKSIRKSKIICLIISCILLISIITTIRSSNNVNVSASTVPQVELIAPDTKNGQVLSIYKDVQKDPSIEGRYRVTLKAQGKPIDSKTKNADIIMVVDTSSSMTKYIGKIRESVKNFCDKMRKTNANINISLIEYNESVKASDYCGINQKGENGTFIFDNKVNNINIEKNKGTNTQAGIMKIGEMLKKAREDAQKYVVFFTDGLPTYSYNYEYVDKHYNDWEFPFFHIIRVVDYNNFKRNKDNSYEIIGNGYDNYDVNFKGAQIEYNKIVGGIKDVGGIGDFSYDNFWNNDSDIISFPDTVDNKKVSFYSVGIVTSDSEREKSMGETFLKTLNNSGYQYSSDFNDANTFYDNIASEITTKINSTIATNVVLKDTVNGQFFKLAQDDQLNIKGIAANSVKKEKIITKDANGNEIKNDLLTINIGEMNKNLEISFNIDVNDEYLSGNNIPTNLEATVSYTSPIINSSVTQTYNIPYVTINPKIGKIIVDKEIYSMDDLGNKVLDKIEGEKEFNLQFIGDNKSYNLNISPKEGEKALRFYMKKPDTLINHKYVNTSEKIGFVDIGQYSVNEILKMTYKEPEFYYSYTENGQYEKLTDKIKVDKDHPLIYIKVVNIYKASNVWRDEKEKSNNLLYPANKD